MQEQLKQITKYMPKDPTIQTQVEDESECNDDTTSDMDTSLKTLTQYPDNQQSDETMTNQKEMSDNKTEKESPDKNEPNLQFNISDRKVVDATAYATKSVQKDDSKSRDIFENSKKPKRITQIRHEANNPYISMGAKRNTNSINLMNNLPRKKPMTNYSSEPVCMVVEGYAFHDDIIGVTHRRSDGNEAYNLILCNMVFDNELEDDGFSAYMAMRDISSGKDDQTLLDNKGYPRFVFMSINAHHFNTAFEGRAAVKEQCEKLRAVSTNIHIVNQQSPSLNTYTIVIVLISYITGCSISNTQYFQLCI